MWRVFTTAIPSKDEHDYPRFKFRITLSPQLLTKALGLHSFPTVFYRDATKEYYFQDSKLSEFVLYDYRATTEFH